MCAPKCEKAGASHEVGDSPRQISSFRLVCRNWRGPCMYSRRDFAKIAAGTIPLARSLWAVNSTIHGVRMAVQSASFTFSGIGIEGIVKTMVDLGIAEIDVMSEHVENFLGAPVRFRARADRDRGRGPPALRAALSPEGAHLAVEEI